MAWRLEKHAKRGLIQNIVPGRVVGTVWLEGLDQPLELNLKGNAYRDLAGARLEFRNPDATVGDYEGLELEQYGAVGDMTASKKVRIIIEDEEADEKDEFKYVWANCLYLEWFSESNGRVLIETTDFKWKVSLPKWQLSEDAEKAQQASNMQAMFNFMSEVSRAIDPAGENDFPDEEEMDEFQWEAFLQKSDARSDMLLELFEKYENDPNCEDIIAEAMGWDIESIEVEEQTVFGDDWETEEAEDSDDVETEKDSFEEPIPNHPIITKMVEITSTFYFEAESRGLLSDDSSNPWNQLVWHSQMTVSKLIAALAPVAEGMDAEPGFVIATLKRALHLVHLTFATLEACVSLQKEDHRWTLEARKDLFALRESIIDLMHTYRNGGSKR